MSRYRIGVDIGGTFTDFTVVDDETGAVLTDKTLTTPRAPQSGVLAGLARLMNRVPGLMPASEQVVHATTLVTNVILERKGAKTGLLATDGFRDVLEMAREVRYDLFDMFIRLPRPLVPRSLRLTVRERVLADGSVFEALDEAGVRAAAETFRREGVAAVAVAFLHAYRNPVHELRAAELLRELLPGITVSLSHRVHPEPKEYERTSTTVVDAYVKSVAEGYLDRLSHELAAIGYRRPLFVMLSNGGTATVETAKSVPVQIVESGPAAGVEAASFFARLTGMERVLAFDMGGTTAKLCVVDRGRAPRTREFEVDRVHRFKAGSGLPVAVPVYDLLEIGAGGGSIARVDDLGLVQVGPDSAGSEPGPACYGRGGDHPTVTDADLVLGYLDAAYFLGGEMSLDLDAARRAIAARVGAPADLDLTSAAAGIHELVNETMAAAGRMYVAEKAMAPSELTLFAFGGAGPVHALGLARKLGCRGIVVPPYSGVMSSLGLLAAPIAFERSRAVRRLLRDLDFAALETAYRALEAEATALLPDPQRARLERTADLRYSGQDHALEIGTRAPCSSAETRSAWEGDFLSAYRDLYGKIDDDNPIELASIRVFARQEGPPPKIAAHAPGGGVQPKSTRLVYDTSARGYVMTPVYERRSIGAGERLIGPAVIEEPMSTTIIGPGDSLVVDATGSLVITLRAGAEEPAPQEAAATAMAGAR